jgi:hypothetical protein
LSLKSLSQPSVIPTRRILPPPYLQPGTHRSAEMGSRRLEDTLPKEQCVLFGEARVPAMRVERMLTVFRLEGTAYSLLPTVI